MQHWGGLRQIWRARGPRRFLDCPGSASRPGGTPIPGLGPGLVPISQVTALKCARLAAPAEKQNLVPAALAGCEGPASPNPTDLHFPGLGLGASCGGYQSWKGQAYLQQKGDKVRRGKDLSPKATHFIVRKIEA